MENNRKLVINSKNPISIDLSGLIDYLEKDYDLSIKIKERPVILENFTPNIFRYIAEIYNHGKFFNWSTLDKWTLYRFNGGEHNLELGRGGITRGHYRDGRIYESLSLSFGIPEDDVFLGLKFSGKNPLPFRSQGIQIKIENDNGEYKMKRQDFTTSLITPMKRSLFKIPIEQLVSGL